VLGRIDLARKLGLLAIAAAASSGTVARATVVVRGPYLQCATPNSVTVRWRTADTTDTRVACGTDIVNLAADFADTAHTTEHEVLVTGLAPATRYWYAIGSSGGLLAGDPTCSFVTPPDPGTVQPVRAWILGDSGQPGATQDSVRDAFFAWTGARGADLWLMLGDNAYSSGTDAQFQAALFAPYATWLRQCVLWPTRGNHDQLHSGANNDYFDLFTLPQLGEAGGLPSGTEAYYSFDYANVHFVCLDSEGSDRSKSGAMVTWLRADLGLTEQDWIVAYWHHPPYSKGSHDSDAEGTLIDMRQNIGPYLDSLNVDLVLSGHSHSYERSFLLRKHYGPSWTLADSMKVDAGDGRRDGNGPYRKPGSRPTRFAGVVYAVAGSSSHTSGGTLNHPVMVSSQNVAGSLVLDVNGGVLDMRFLDAAGAVTDSFTILKLGLAAVGDGPAPGRGFELLPASPLPARDAVELSYRLPRAGRAKAMIFDGQGRRIAVVADGAEPAGLRRVRWDARGASGAPAPAGVYYAVVEFGGERRATRVVLTP
jgi:calcineurin-like phosphoesterase family protein/purple acid phosphatase-like protein/flagellar hook capping protein FlgD